MSSLRQLGWSYPVKGGIAIASTMPPLTEASIDRARCIVTAIITTPTKDRQGEIVEPLGGLYADYANNPVVFFDHRSNMNYPNAIAMAREHRDAPLEVFPTELSVTAKHYFNQSDPMSMQCFRLIDDGLLLGISLGFNAVQEYAEPIGMRPDGKGKAFRYRRWHDLEHTHTPLGVNAEALTIAVQKGRVGSEPMLPMIVKSFTDYALPTPTYSTGWTPETKAMPPEDDKLKEDEAKLGEEKDKPVAAPDPAATTDKAEKPPKPMKPSARMLMDTAQGLHDFDAHCDKMMETAEHPESIDAMHHVKELVSQAKDHVEGALATHHPEVKYEAPPEGPENEDKDQPKEGMEDKEGEYKVKSHKWVAPRFGPLGGTTIAISRTDEEALTPEQRAEAEREIKRLKYELAAGLQRKKARA